MDLHSPHTPRNMAVVFEPSRPTFWCKTDSTSFFYHVHDTPTPSAFYNFAAPLMGPSRRSPTSHRSDPTDGERVPRPPNAWILYRSDKLKEMSPPPPGMPRPLQADISKTISAMWRSEPPEIRADYERLSDIKKAEHALAYPAYRFHPVKKADKERIRAERLAEKERERSERSARKLKPRTRSNASKPLFTTEARFGPAGPSPPASGASTPSTGHSTSLPPPALLADQPTPPFDHSSTPVPPTSSPSSYPPSPSTTTIPPLVAPQPGVPQRLPSASDWPNQQQQDGQTQPNEQEFNALWLDQAPLPDMLQFAQEYLTVPAFNQNPQQPLGWSPHDPSPSTGLPFYISDPLRAVLAATDDPHIFNLADFDFNSNELFDGSRPIEVSMGSNMISFGGDNHLQAFASLLSGLEHPTQCDLNKVAITNQPAQSGHSVHVDVPSTSTIPLGFNNPEWDSFDNYIHAHALQGFVSLEAPPVDERQGQAAVPYAPPAGASITSNRRVAAQWRHI